MARKVKRKPDCEKFCAKVIAENGRRIVFCGARSRPGSSYCADHHERLHYRMDKP
jgi:hypothetical protein